MTPLDADFEAFLARFNHGNDGLIRRARVELPAQSALGGFEVELSVLDLEGNGDDAWVNLRLHVTDCVELRVSHGPRADCRVLSNGVQVARDGEWVVLDLDPQDDGPPTRSKVARSLFHAVGKAVTFEVLPYSPS